MLGKAAEEMYDKLYETLKDDGSTSVEKQRTALDKVFAVLRLSEMDAWREDFKTNGYVKIYSPVIDDFFFLAHDKKFDEVNKGVTSVVTYSTSELKNLKDLSQDQLKWLHEGKRATKGLVIR